MDSKDNPELFDEVPPAPPASRWQRFKLLVKVVEIRLRFVVILVGTGLVIGYWDTLQNYWDKWTRPKTAAVAVEADAEFYCPMHPWVTRANRDPDGAIPKCPICGMSMSSRKKGEKPELPPNVTGRVQFSPDRIRLGGLKTEPVAYRALVKEIVTVGSVRYDESQLSRIVTRVSGYVERLLVNKTYETVGLGQPMVEIYSPELASTVRELLLASKSGSQSGLASLARARLGLLGVAPSEIDQVLRSGDAGQRLLIRSPQQGHVIQKDVVNGAHVEAGQSLFEVADISKVWIEADVYEKDISFLQDGQTIQATVEAVPGRVFKGKVALVHPMMDESTRTNAVRFFVENEGGALRPGMFATVKIAVPRGEVLAIPEPAVIDTGAKRVVYVEREPGIFEGVAVELGPRVGEFYPVIRGVSAGDRVVARGAFLVDAETRLNPSAGAAYSGGGGATK